VATRQIPWARVLVEGVVIVASILLALAADAWWDERQDLAEERRILTALSIEFAANRERFDTLVAVHEGVRQAALAVLDAAANPEVEIPRDSADYLLSDILWGGAVTWVTGATDALMATGDLALIRNEALQSRLAAWPRILDRVAAAEEEDVYTQMELLVPYYIRRGYLPQIFSATRGVPGTTLEVPHSEVDLPAAPGGVDHRLLLSDREFQNIAAMRHTNQLDYRTAFVEFEQAIDSIQALIEGELAR